MKKILLSAAIMGASMAASAQANFWNLNGSYMDCNSATSATGTLSSTSYPLFLYQSDASSFPIPGLCETYCNLSGSTAGRVRSYQINHITEGYVPSIAGFTFGAYSLSFGATIYEYENSIAATKLKADGSRDIYAFSGRLILKIATISATGAVSNTPTTLYTLPGGAGPLQFDRWTDIEVSSDGNYVLLVGPDALTLEVYNIATGVLTSYPAPGGGSNRIQGFEFVNMATPRLYVSYNNRSAANPTGTGGVAYYNLGNTSTYTSVTTSIDYGFSEIELAKNGLLYLASAGTSPAYNFTGAGTVYTLSTSGTLAATSYTVPANNNVPGGAYCNKYLIQKQIDGEDYNAGSFTAPSVDGLTVTLLHVTGFTGPSPSTPTVPTCQPELLPLECTFKGLTTGYELTITRGAISGTTFTADPLYSPIVYTKTSYYANSISGQIIPGTALSTWNECDWKIQIKPTGTCSTGTVHTVYYRIRKPVVTASAPKLKGIFGSGTPSYSSTPIWYRCGSEALNLDFSLSGTPATTVTGYDIKVTKGSISASNVFTPAGGSDNVTQSNTAGAVSISKLLLPASFVPETYVGSDWKIEITPKSACGTGAVNVSYYKVRSAAATVDFMIRSVYCTSTMGKQPRTTTVAGIAALGTVAGPVCSQGNLPANSAGFFPPTLSDPFSPTGFNVKLEEVDASGAPLSIPNVIYDYSDPAVPSSYYGMTDFIIAGVNTDYFKDNYLAVKGSKIFKLTMSVTTAECGLSSAFSYFKILNDGAATSPSAGRNWRTTENGALTQAQAVEVNVMPNPATNNVKVAWYVSETSDENTNFTLIDVLGKEVLHQQWAEQKGSNEQNVNINQLAPGMYQYRLETAGTVKSGKLIKQ